MSLRLKAIVREAEKSGHDYFIALYLRCETGPRENQTVDDKVPVRNRQRVASATLRIVQLHDVPHLQVWGKVAVKASWMDAADCAPGWLHGAGAGRRRNTVQCHRMHLIIVIVNGYTRSHLQRGPHTVSSRLSWVRVCCCSRASSRL